MNLKAAIERVEKAINMQDKPCGCFRSYQGIRPRTVVYYPEDGDQKPSTVCEVCGGQMTVICVVYEKPDFLNYHA
jgi:hypothetical protein